MPDDKLEKNKAIVRRMLEAFNTGNGSIVAEVLHPDVKDKSRQRHIVDELRDKPAHQRVQTEIMLEHEAFPDMKFKEESITAEGDRVILRWSMTGTHKGKLLGRKGTGKKVKVFGTEIVRIQDGKIVEHDDDGTHVLDMLRQLGMLTPTVLRKLQLDADEDGGD